MPASSRLVASLCYTGAYCIRHAASGDAKRQMRRADVARERLQAADRTREQQVVQVHRARSAGRVSAVGRV